MKDEFWDNVCGTMPWWHTLAIVNVVFLFLLGYSFLFVDPGSGSFVAAVITLVVVTTYLALYGTMRYKCAQREA